MKIIAILALILASSCSHNAFKVQGDEIYPLVNPTSNKANFVFTPLLLHMTVDLGLNKFEACTGLIPEQRESLNRLFAQQKMAQVLIFESDRMTVVKDKAKEHVLINIHDDVSLKDALGSCQKLENFFLSEGFKRD